MAKYFGPCILGACCAIGQKNPGCLAVIKDRLISYLRQRRYFSDKDKIPREPAKEEEISLKMPGFVHPETMKEEGYFTQKAKKQLEELKRKAEDPTTVHTPEKKL